MKKELGAGTIKILVDEHDIKNKVIELGRQITEDYKNLYEDLIVVCLLRGAAVFMSDLVREIKLPLKIDFMVTSSYGTGSVSTEVKIKKELDENIAGKHVLIVEDIVDTGKTLHKIVDILKTRGPKSIKICTLLDKPERREVQVSVDYVGFKIPDEFVVGFGLDYNQENRNLPSVHVVGTK
ncbi:MAG: hypoxanthine phosphoribosyltransferase [Fusobacteriaceae bacterium]